MKNINKKLKYVYLIVNLENIGLLSERQRKNTDSEKNCVRLGLFKRFCKFLLPSCVFKQMHSSVRVIMSVLFDFVASDEMICLSCRIF